MMNPAAFLSHLLFRGERAGLSVLIFHRVLAEPDDLFPDTVDAARFDTILSWLGRSFNVLALPQAIALLAQRRLPPNAVSITFDDGYEDNHSVALPLLLKHGMSASFFVATDFLDGGIMWNDRIIEAVRHAPRGSLDLSQWQLGTHQITAASRRRVIEDILTKIKYWQKQERESVGVTLSNHIGYTVPRNLMMRAEHVAALAAAGMTVGGHTCSHPILAKLTDDDAANEIRRNKEILEGIVGRGIELFAYPNGKPGDDYLPVHVEIVKRLGYKAALSTSPGACRHDSDRYQLPRFTPWDTTESRYCMRLVRNMM